MKALKTIGQAALLTVGLGAASAYAAPITFSNGDFEAGNLSGWNTIGSVIATPSTTVTTYNSVVWTVNAAGNFMAQLQSAGAAVSTIESTLGVAAGTLNALNTNPDGGALTNGSALYRSFSANAGDTLSFAWNYVATDYIPYNDPAFALLIGPSASTTVLASINGLGTAVGTSGNSGWMNFNSTIGTAGNYTLAFVTTNDKDTILNSFLHIDASAGTCNPNCPQVGVPEPGSLGILGAAFTGLALITRRRKLQIEHA